MINPKTPKPQNPKTPNCFMISNIIISIICCQKAALT
jgi:hypothetical protein